MSLCKPSTVNAMPTRSSAYNNARIPLQGILPCCALHAAPAAMHLQRWRTVWVTMDPPVQHPGQWGVKLLPIDHHKIPVTLVRVPKDAPQSTSDCYVLEPMQQTNPPHSIKGLGCIPEKQPRRETLPGARLQDVGQAVHVINAAAPATEASLAHM